MALQEVMASLNYSPGWLYQTVEKIKINLLMMLVRRAMISVALDGTIRKQDIVMLFKMQHVIVRLTPIINYSLSGLTNYTPLHH